MLNFIVAYEAMGLIAWFVILAITAYSYVLNGFSIKSFFELVLRNFNWMDIPKAVLYAVIWPIEAGIAIISLTKCIRFFKK